MGYGSRAFLAGGLGFAAAFVVACGGGNGLLTGNQASTLNSQLDSVSAAVAARQCGAAASAARAFGNQVGLLPSTVSTALQQNLAQGAATVGDLAARDCQATTSSSSSSSTPTSSSTSATTSTTTTTTTTTTPTTTSSTSTTPSTSSSSSTQTTNTNSTSPTATNTSSTGTATTSNGGTGFGTGTSGNGQ